MTLESDVSTTLLKYGIHYKNKEVTDEILKVIEGAWPLQDAATSFLGLEKGDRLTYVMDLRGGRKSVQVTKAPKGPEPDTQ